MPDLDPTLAPPGYRARLQTAQEKAPLGFVSCEGCCFEKAARDVAGPLPGACNDRPCAHYERPDGLSVVFEKTADQPT